MTGTSGKPKKGLPLAVVAVTVAATLSGAAIAGAAPVREKLSSHVGWEVDTATKGKICLAIAVCQFGVESGEPGGFRVPTGVATNSDAASSHHEDVYVTDTANARVQELSLTGQFVAMFGWEVNQTKDGEPTATQAEKNVCTEEEIESKGVKCKAGAEGSAAGQFSLPASVAVDPKTGNVFVQDLSNWRVEEFTPTGGFVLMIGRHVNESTGGNICTEKEIEVKSVKCKAGEPGVPGAAEAGAFDFAFVGDALAFGGPKDLLYVGDEQRVQELDAEGNHQGEIPLNGLSSEPSVVTALAVDGAGNAYVVYRVNGNSDTVYEVEPNGKEIKSTKVSHQEVEATSSTAQIEALAIDASGRLALSGRELGFTTKGEFSRVFGLLYDAGTGRLMSDFATGSTSGVTFNDQDELYAAVSPGNNGHEVLIYEPLPVAELQTLVPTCALGPDNESNVEFRCALKGEINPEGISETEAWFEWGPPFGFETAKQGVSSAGAVETTIEGLTPNETIQARLAASDHNAKPPEAVSGEVVALSIPAVAPRVVGEPSASQIGSSSAVMFGELNPENANTEYYFEYGSCDHLSGCPTVVKTQKLKSATYGAIGTTQDATGLQPSKIYHFRLVASNQATAVGPEGTFTTAPPPVPSAATGLPSATGTNAATITGTVDPDGQPATYGFELGVYDPAGTQYTTVFTGPAGASTTSVVETLTVTGLQPGTVYSYRIKVTSGYGVATGAALTFATEGLPAVLVSPATLPMLAVPKIAFPKQMTPPKHKTKNKSKLKKKHKASHKQRGRKQKG